MGFSLRNERVLRFFHLLAALLLPVALLVITSCKQAHEERADLGPSADPSIINDTFEKAIAGATVATLQVHQSLNYEESLRIANQDPNLLMGEHGIQVIDRTNDADTQETRITIHHSQKVRDMDKNIFVNIESEDTISLPEQASSTGSGMLMAVESGFISIAATPQDAPQPVRITYHNFSTSTDLIDPPSKVKSRSDCGGLTGCRLHVTYISYDEEKWYNDTDYDKYKYDFAFTTQLPYMNGLFGVLVTGCVGFYQSVSNRRYFVRDCQYLTDFQK